MVIFGKKVSTSGLGFPRWLGIKENFVIRLQFIRFFEFINFCHKIYNYRITINIHSPVVMFLNIDFKIFISWNETIYKVKKHNNDMKVILNDRVNVITSTFYIINSNKSWNFPKRPTPTSMVFWLIFSVILKALMIQFINTDPD